LSDEEADAIKNYVAEGGMVYASKFSMKSKLSEMLGVSFMEETKEKYTYIAPTSEGTEFLPEITKKYPLSIADSQIKTDYKSKNGVMATILLPYTSPDNSTKFVSIHSNPPGVSTDYPAIVHKKFGKGSIFWSSASIETLATQSLKHRTILAHIIRNLTREPFSFEAVAPECIEIILFHKPDERRYLINIFSSQSEIGIPNIPVDGILVRVRVKGKTLKITSLPDRKPIPFKQNGEYVSMKVPKIQTFRMLLLDYE
jgi:hypothetical protein